MTDSNLKPSNTINKILKDPKEDLIHKVKNFREQRIIKLRRINHWWNISLTVIGIVFTLLAGFMGFVDSDEEKIQNLAKIAIGFFSVSAVAVQTANTEFRVRNKAETYTLISAESEVLEDKIQYAKDDELPKLREKYYDLIQKAAKAEAEFSKEK